MSDIDKKVNEVANSEVGKKMGLTTTTVYILLAIGVLIVASKVFGF